MKPRFINQLRMSKEVIDALWPQLVVEWNCCMSELRYYVVWAEVNR